MIDLTDSEKALAHLQDLKQRGHYVAIAPGTITINLVGNKSEPVCVWRIYVPKPCNATRDETWSVLIDYSDSKAVSLLAEKMPLR